MTQLNKAMFLGLSAALNPVKFQLPNSDKDEHIFLKQINAGERECYECAMAESYSDTAVRATFLSHVICDQSGKLLFTVEDIPEINKMPNALIYPMFTKAQEINGLLPTDMDEAEKN